MPPKLKNAVLCFSGTFEAPVANLQKWTEANGGTFDRKLTPSTTHLVVSEANWRARVPEVKTALANGTKVIDYEWFDDKLRVTGRVTENKYLWTTIDAERLKQEAKEARAAEREKKRAEKEKEKKKKDAERINYADAFMQHTNEVAHISDEGSSGEEEDGSSSEDDSPAKKHSALAEQFAKGAKQAKEDLMSDNHHIYMDSTGFSYDIVVTKASVELSRLDRARITLYETNASPHTYAVYVKIPAYIPATKYDVTTVRDVNYPTAFKCLRENFKTFTGVEWDARFKKFSDGPSLAPLPRPKITVVAPAKNSPPGKLSKVTKTGKNSAKAEAEDPETKQKRWEAAFAASKYRYRLPAEGEPRGTMADGSHYTHQNNKSVYDLFDEAADRSHEVIAAREAFKEEVERLKKLELRKQMRKSGQNKQVEPVEVVVIDSDDEEEDDEESEEEEDEEMEDGYVAAKVNGRDADMQVNGGVNSMEPGIEQDYIMVDAATTQT